MGNTCSPSDIVDNTLAIRDNNNYQKTSIDPSCFQDKLVQSFYINHKCGLALRCAILNSDVLLLRKILALCKENPTDQQFLIPVRFKSSEVLTTPYSYALFHRKFELLGELRNLGFGPDHTVQFIGQPIYDMNQLVAMLKGMSAEEALHLQAHSRRGANGKHRRPTKVVVKSFLCKISEETFNESSSNLVDAVAFQ